jgi:RimJ/RimL family protein N-acetyltransferase
MQPLPIRLTAADAADFVELRLRMLEEAPWAFAASPANDRASDPEHLSHALSKEAFAIFAVEAEVRRTRAAAARETAPFRRRLAAAAGLFRQETEKFVHRARLWGVFVEPAYRGRGLGRIVVAAAIDLARTWEGVDYIDLGVSENSTAALRLYESLGFRQWGREPETLQHDGRRYDEIYMSLRL